MRMLAALLCVAFTIASTTAAYAQPRGGGGGRSAPAMRPAPAPAMRTAPAPAMRAAPAPARGGGGFQLNRDLAPAPQAAAPQRIAQPQRVAQPQRPQAPAVQARAPQPRARQPGRPNGAQVAVRNNPPRQSPGNTGTRRQIGNPAFHGNAWGWNRGVVWNPAPAYWGGGFWGALSFTAGAAFFGDLIDSGQTYESYAVYPDSPGATLLANYQLTQTPCGPPDLVVIWGPDDSLICAFPNATVGPGEYDVDPTTLSLVSE
jgi:hypothetical protein